MELTWEWCELCDAAFIRCPKCHNNSCNGGYGEMNNGEKCDVCPICYQYQKLAYETKRAPRTKEEIKKIKI